MEAVAGCPIEESFAQRVPSKVQCMGITLLRVFDKRYDSVNG